MIEEHSAGAVLYRYFTRDTIKFLLLHYTAGHWDFPKGNVEVGETERKTVIREIFEETGITNLRFVEGFVQSIFYKYKRSGNLIQKRVSFYLVQTPTKVIALSNEHQDFLWANRSAALRTLTYRSARNILTAASRFINDRQVL